MRRLVALAFVLGSEWLSGEWAIRFEWRDSGGWRRTSSPFRALRRCHESRVEPLARVRARSRDGFREDRGDDRRLRSAWKRVVEARACGLESGARTAQPIRPRCSSQSRKRQYWYPHEQALDMESDLRWADGLRTLLDHAGVPGWLRINVTAETAALLPELMPLSVENKGLWLDQVGPIYRVIKPTSAPVQRRRPPMSLAIIFQDDPRIGPFVEALRRDIVRKSLHRGGYVLRRAAQRRSARGTR